MNSGVVLETSLSYPAFARGKVRDIYLLPGDRLLMVATDRISAFDHILPTTIPDKGRVLTLLSAFWFERTAQLCRSHFLSLDLDGLLSPGETVDLRGRAMVVRRARRIDAECVVRGYLAGSGWEEYRSGGAVAGLRLPGGLGPGDPLPEPVFTPATKAAAGHDQNIPFTELAHRVGADLAARLREVSLRLYAFARAHAANCGLILADTKFEFGLAPDGTLLLIDEVLTPDSSRYWDERAYRRGELIPFDKQFVRDYLTRINWNREPPAPQLPAEIVTATTERYRDVYRRLVGVPLPEEP